MSVLQIEELFKRVEDLEKANAALSLTLGTLIVWIGASAGSPITVLEVSTLLGMMAVAESEKKP